MPIIQINTDMKSWRIFQPSGRIWCLRVAERSEVANVRRAGGNTRGFWGVYCLKFQCRCLEAQFLWQTRFLQSSLVHHFTADLILFFYIILRIQIRNLTRCSPPKFCIHVWFLLFVLNSMLKIAHQISLPQQFYVAGIYHIISRHIDPLFPIFETEEPVGCSVLVYYSRGHGFDSLSRFSLHLSFLLSFQENLGIGPQNLHLSTIVIFPIRNSHLTHTAVLPLYEDLLSTPKFHYHRL
jgi:hypothetical protein